MNSGRISKQATTIVAMAAALVASLSGAASAGTIYWTNLAGFGTTNQFWKYDTGGDSWTRLNDFHTGSNLAVDQNGDVYAYRGDRQAIVQYDATNDLWNGVMSAPSIGAVHDDPNAFNFFNLEVTNQGRFMLTGGGRDTNLYYSDGGGIWNTLSLGFSTNATGDYDTSTGQYAITPFVDNSPTAVDSQTLSVTSFTGSGSGSDWRRSGTLLNDTYYIQTSGNGIEAWDMSDPAAAPTTFARPGNVIWMASDADLDNDLLYMANGFGTDFYAWDGNAYTQLANTPGGGNHTSIAFVADAVPEPATLGLFGLGLAGLGLAARRHRTA